MLQPTFQNQDNASPSSPPMEGPEPLLPLQAWLPRALALIDQPVLVVKLADLSLFWANEAAKRHLLAAAAGREPLPQHLIPELEAYGDAADAGLLPPGFCLRWKAELPAGRREGDVVRQAEVTLEVLAGQPEGLAILVIAERETTRTARSSTGEHAQPAKLDSLTGLPERDYFEDRLRESLAAQEQGSAPVAVAFIDVDRFKEVNDSRGHLAGDDVLRALADCLRNSLRPGDVVARYGGDEFVVLLHGVRSLRQGRGVARRLKQALTAERLCTTASLGLAVVNVRQANPLQVLKAADDAMYQAKRRGHAGHTEVRPLVPLDSLSAASQAPA